MKSTLFLSILVVLALLAISIPTHLNAATPQLVNYQGQLTDGGGNPLDTTVSMMFSVYDVSSAGTALWAETHSGVVVSGGVFSVILGSITDLSSSVFSDAPRYLGVKVGADAAKLYRCA